MNNFLVGILKWIYGVFVGGLVFMKYYFWFAFPVFSGLPQINYFQAIGLSSFLYLFQQIRTVDLGLQQDLEKKDLVKYGSIIIPWIVLGMGYLVHLIITTFGG